VEKKELTEMEMDEEIGKTNMCREKSGKLDRDSSPSRDVQPSPAQLNSICNACHVCMQLSKKKIVIETQLQKKGRLELV
jgi:hypothetical protein